MDAIRCEGLSRTYGSVQALDQLNLAVGTGSVFGFLGRNGAGKTTTIRLLTGLARPTSGNGWVAGVLATDGDNTAREMFGYLPEEPTFYNWMTPTEFLDYVGRVFGLGPDERRQRINELIELSGLEDARRRRIGGFSRGMRQRLGLAQALVHRPPVLFLDEPTSALDPAGRRDVLQLIDTLRGHTTVFLSSHILADVERVCDTIGIIHEGRLVMVEDRERLLAKYAANAAILELESFDSLVMDSMIAILKQRPWTTSVSVESGALRLVVNDVITAKQELLEIVAQQKIVLNRYEWVRPTLEDIFLRISA